VRDVVQQSVGLCLHVVDNEKRLKVVLTKGRCGLESVASAGWRTKQAEFCRDSGMPRSYAIKQSAFHQWWERTKKLRGRNEAYFVFSHGKWVVTSEDLHVPRISVRFRGVLYVVFRHQWMLPGQRVLRILLSFGNMPPRSLN
jgi:hypothetical protein